MDTQIDPGEGYRLLAPTEVVREADWYKVHGGWMPAYLDVGEVVLADDGPWRRRIHRCPEDSRYRLLDVGEMIIRTDETHFGRGWHPVAVWGVSQTANYDPDRRRLIEQSTLQQPKLEPQQPKYGPVQAGSDDKSLPAIAWDPAYVALGVGDIRLEGDEFSELSGWRKTALLSHPPLAASDLNLHSYRRPVANLRGPKVGDLWCGGRIERIEGRATGYLYVIALEYKLTYSLKSWETMRPTKKPAVDDVFIKSESRKCHFCGKAMTETVPDARFYRQMSVSGAGQTIVEGCTISSSQGMIDISGGSVTYLSRVAHAPCYMPSTRLSRVLTGWEADPYPTPGEERPSNQISMYSYLTGAQVFFTNAKAETEVILARGQPVEVGMDDMSGENL